MKNNENLDNVKIEKMYDIGNTTYGLFSPIGFIGHNMVFNDLHGDTFINDINLF